MQKLVSKLAGYLIPAFLVFIALFLAWKNYTPGTYLIGWDSLHPEFNFGLAFERAISGVWRGEQGVGAISAHSHMADLPRIFFLWLSSFVFQESFLRYFYIFLTLILGPLGTYFFLEYILGKKLVSRLGAFLGTSYYLLNLGTLQHFYIPFEMFQTAFAFLPWLFFLGLKYLREGKRTNLIWFVLVTIIASPMAYAGTLFYASILGLFLFLVSYSLIASKKLLKLKRSLVLVFFVFALNSYWILPNLYSVVNQSEVVTNSKINVLFSPEAFLRNQEYGTPEDILTHKNFLFSWRAYDFKQGVFDDLMGTWSQHLNRELVANLGLAISGLVIFGLLVGLIKLNKVSLTLIPTSLFCLFFLINANPPTGGLYLSLYTRFGLFREAFRLPFTKFSILFELAAAFYFGYGASYILGSFSKNKFTKFLVFPVLVLVSVGLFVYMKPAFEGELISPKVRRELPGEYSELFEWFRKQQDGRVATFPIHTHWGWEYHDWKYEGSGFEWFGIENPILARDFDRWSSYNETFYNQASFALYSKDKEAFENTLSKHQVKYLLLDESIMNAGGGDALLFIPELKEMIRSSERIKEIAKFGSLRVFQTNFETREVVAPQSYVEVNANLDYSQVDPIYSKYNTYVQNKDSLGFPFVNLDRRGDVEVEVREDQIVITNPEVNSKVILPITEKIEEDFSQNRGFKEAYNCDLLKVGSVSRKNQIDKIVYEASEGGVSCDFFYYPDLSYDQAYLLRITGENKEGRSLKIYLQNTSTNRMDLEELLPQERFDESYFILPKGIEGAGYTLNLETRSFGRIASENVLTSVEFIPVPEWVLTLQTAPGIPTRIGNNLEINSWKKFGTGFYQVETKGEGLLVLGQGYESGWIAFDRDYQILPHIKVNSWANGWIIEGTRHQALGNSSENSNAYSLVPSASVVIIFWPQLLEYLGFVLMASIFVFIFWPQRRVLVDKPVSTGLK